MVVEKLAFLLLVLRLLKFIREDTNGKLYCDVVQHQLNPSMAQIPQKRSDFFTRKPTSLAFIKYRERKNRQLTSRCTRKTPDLNPIEML